MTLDSRLKSEVEDKLKKLIVGQLKYSHIDITPENIKPDSNFYDLGADNIDLMELRMAVEETYRIDISNEDAQKILTVGQAIDYISKQINDLAEKPGPWRDFVNRLT